MSPEASGSEPREPAELGLEEALFELDRYQRGFENLERQVRVLDRERQKLAVVLNNARVGFLVVDQARKILPAIQSAGLPKAQRAADAAIAAKF